MLLIVFEPLKHVSIDRIYPKFIFVGIHDTTIDFEINRLHYFPITPCIMNKSGEKVPYSISSVHRLCSNFLPRSFDAKHRLMVMDCYLEALNLKNLMSKKYFLVRYPKGTSSCV